MFRLVRHARLSNTAPAKLVLHQHTSVSQLTFVAFLLPLWLQTTQLCRDLTSLNAFWRQWEGPQCSERKKKYNHIASSRSGRWPPVQVCGSELLFGSCSGSSVRHASRKISLASFLRVGLLVPVCSSASTFCTSTPVLWSHSSKALRKRQVLSLGCVRNHCQKMHLKFFFFLSV